MNKNELYYYNNSLIRILEITDTSYFVIDCVKCNMLLPAGSTTNINPTLFINAYNEKYNDDVIYRITRLDVFNDKGESFK